MAAAVGRNVVFSGVSNNPRGALKEVSSWDSVVRVSTSGRAVSWRLKSSQPRVRWEVRASAARDQLFFENDVADFVRPSSPSR
jgi:hypothetical protein